LIGTAEEDSDVVGVLVGQTHEVLTAQIGSTTMSARSRVPM